MAEDKAACVGYLIVEELTEVLLVHPALLGIDYRGEAVQLHIVCVDILHSLDDIAELADTRGLDKDTVGLVLLQHLHQSLAEIAHQRAAYAARIHLGDLNARILQKAAVDTYLTELVLDEDELLILISLCDELLYQRGLACAQEAAEYGYLCHFNTLSFLIIL